MEIKSCLSRFKFFKMDDRLGHHFKPWMGEEYLIAYPWLIILVVGYLFALCQFLVIR